VQALRALGWLLQYPDEGLRAALPELARELASESRISARARGGLVALVAELHQKPLLDLEERYVGLFDRTRGLSLHLHEHVHGDARERGEAMVRLRRIYESAGLELLPGELPDFLPVLCEFLSLRPCEEARALLSDAAAVLKRIQLRLEQRESRYGAVFDALGELAGARDLEVRDPDPAAAHLPGLAALDAAWEEAPVSFGSDAGTAGCGLAKPQRSQRL
jgi:nitrate reductase delta subunit